MSHPAPDHENLRTALKECLLIMYPFCAFLFEWVRASVSLPHLSRGVVVTASFYQSQTLIHAFHGNLNNVTWNMFAKDYALAVQNPDA